MQEGWPLPAQARCLPHRCMKRKDGVEMEALAHGGDLTGYARRFPGKPLLDFSASLNPLGMPALVRAALHQAVGECERYPDPLCRELSEQLAARWRLSPEQIFCGNGAAEIFDRLAAVLRPGAALLTAPSFSEYERALRSNGCDCRFHVLRSGEDFAVTGRILSELTGEIEAVLLCSPNNPTGQVIGSELFDRIAARCAEIGAWLVVDECFSGFLADDGARSMRRWLDRYERLVVVRAFTKLYALAGVRLGWCMTQDTSLIRALRAAGQPWNVSYLAQKAGTAALLCGGFVRETVCVSARERAFLAEGLQRCGLWVCPGQANFVLFRSEEHRLSERLLPHGILLRDCAAFRGLGPGWYRAAVRKHMENEQLLNTLWEVLHGKDDYGAGHML